MSTTDPYAEPAFDRPGTRAAVHAQAGLALPGSGGHRLSSRELFAGRNEVEIAHGDAVYRLRITSLGKLILTK